mmetsp:Transcript_33937/g.88406  ORF Transcript_33937/g.88406 Transcript_33937/m.88406 type:complete len:220 (+) Transcript_33937:653-1312(+)
MVTNPSSSQESKLRHNLSKISRLQNRVVCTESRYPPNPTANSQAGASPNVRSMAITACTQPITVTAAGARLRLDNSKILPAHFAPNSAAAKVSVTSSLATVVASGLSSQPLWDRGVWSSAGTGSANKCSTRRTSCARSSDWRGVSARVEQIAMASAQTRTRGVSVSLRPDLPNSRIPTTSWPCPASPANSASVILVHCRRLFTTCMRPGCNTVVSNHFK